MLKRVCKLVYEIYELIEPEHLQKVVPDGYYMKTLERSILQKADFSSFFTSEHETMESAINEINKLINDVNTGHNLIILPVYKVFTDS